MKPEPLEPSGTRLFAAARLELPPVGAEQRALAAALRARQAAPRAASRTALVASASTALLLAAAVALLMRRPQRVESISAEPANARFVAPPASHTPPPSIAESSAPIASSRPGPGPGPGPGPSPLPSALRSPLSSSAAPAASTITLSDELDALKVASSALNSGDSAGALAALDRYDRVLKGSKLRAEATMLRIQALARSGDAQAASTLAQRFVAQNPESPLVDRARSFIRTTDSGGN